MAYHVLFNLTVLLQHSLCHLLSSPPVSLFLSLCLRLDRGGLSAAWLSIQPVIFSEFSINPAAKPGEDIHKRGSQRNIRALGEM